MTRVALFIAELQSSRLFWHHCNIKWLWTVVVLSHWFAYAFLISGSQRSLFLKSRVVWIFMFTCFSCKVSIWIVLTHTFQWSMFAHQVPSTMNYADMPLGVADQWEGLERRMDRQCWRGGLPTQEDQAGEPTANKHAWPDREVGSCSQACGMIEHRRYSLVNIHFTWKEAICRDSLTDYVYKIIQFQLQIQQLVAVNLNTMANNCVRWQQSGNVLNATSHIKP